MIKVYVTNLAKYNNGELFGEWLELPNSEDFIQEVLDKVLGSDEEYFITDYEFDYNFDIKLDEYSNVFELNELAERIEGVKDNELIDAVLRCIGTNDLYEVLDKVEGQDFLWFRGISNAEELGRMIVDEGLFGIQIPESLEKYLDYEAIGNDWDMEIYDDLRIAITLY